MPTHYLKVLANQSNRGDLDLLLAEHYLNTHKWSLAKNHIDKIMSNDYPCDPLKVEHINREISLKLGLKA